jgi:Na+/H+ antiporter NhaD/arsenite permease-like protein
MCCPFGQPCAMIAALLWTAPWWLGTSEQVAAIAAVVIFIATYAVMAVGKLPGFYLDRAGAALLGASLMVATGLPLNDAYRAIDVDTIALLLGMMIVVANMRLSGFFGLVNNAVVTRARHPITLLAAVTFVSGFFSAFLVNDAICLALTPLVIGVVTRLRRNPLPYLLAVAMASNVGSVATITGNPQNIMIGSVAQISYATFAGALWPIAAAGVILVMTLIILFFPAEFWTSVRLKADAHVEQQSIPADRPLMIKSLLIVVAMMTGYFVGQPPAKVALIAGAVLLVTRRVRPENVYHQVDWPLLLMFVGLFVVVAGFEKVALTPELVAAIGALHLDQPPVLSLVTAALANMVSNVPAVLVLKPFVASLPDPQQAWLTIAMSATLAGNLTLVGSVANLIVVQIARAHDVTIGFWDYARVGAPVAVLTILIGIMRLTAIG